MNISDYKKYEPFFGSWYIKDKLGEGAYGSVYLIEREDMGVTYRAALKAITIPKTNDEVESAMSDGMTREEVTVYYQELVTNIVSEFVLMSRLKGNSHIVSYEDHAIYEHEDDIGWDIFIRMELLTPLVSLTKETTLAEKEVIKLGISICRALEFCRKYKIVHRDIKPENIFLAPSGDYKIGDFGIATTVEKTQIGLSRKGTFVYMAPEAYRGDAYGQTVDIYSLGIVMYKLLNHNRTPFLPDYPNPISYSDREEALVRRFKAEELPPMNTGSDELQRIVLKATKYDPAKRYHSAAEMRLDLERLLLAKHGMKMASEPDGPIDDDIMRAVPSSLAMPDNEHAGEDAELTVIAPRTQAKKIARKRSLLSRLVAACIAVMAICVIILPKEPTGIEGINNDETIYYGEQLTPRCTVKPWYLSSKKIEYDIADTELASIDADGVITANKVGTTKLTLTAGNYTKEVTLSIIPKITEISDIPGTLNLTAGGTHKLSPTLSPAKFRAEPVTYASSDKSVVKVSKKGLVTAVSEGSAELTMSAGGYDKIIEVTVSSPSVYAPATAGAGRTANSTKSKSTQNASNSSSSKSSTSASKDKAKKPAKRDYVDESDDEFF